MFDQSNVTYNLNKDIRFKTTQIRDNLCDFNEAYIAVTGKVNATLQNLPANINPLANNIYNRKIALKNLSPFFNCILKITIN